jgi:hypothetical protein
LTRAIQAASIVVDPAGLVWQFHAAGMRMALKPAAFTLLMSA